MSLGGRRLVGNTPTRCAEDLSSKPHIPVRSTSPSFVREKRLLNWIVGSCAPCIAALRLNSTPVIICSCYACNNTFDVTVFKIKRGDLFLFLVFLLFFSCCCCYCCCSSISFSFFFFLLLLLLLLFFFFFFSVSSSSSFSFFNIIAQTQVHVYALFLAAVYAEA